jgi:hypothetical protein
VGGAAHMNRILVAGGAVLVVAVGVWVLSFRGATRGPAPSEPTVTDAAVPGDGGVEQRPTQACLMPLMINRDELIAALEADDAGEVLDELAFLEWRDPLGVGFVCDDMLTQNAVWLSHSQLAGLGLDAGSALAVSIANLERRLKGLEFVPIKNTGVGTNRYDDVYAAGFLLLDREWDAIEAAQGDVLVAVPSRARMYVSPWTKEAEAPLRQLAAQAFRVEPNPLTELVLGRRDGGWSFLPPR